MLKVSDLPAGWRATKPGSSDPTKYYDDIDDCGEFGRASHRSEKLPRARSQFAQGDTQIANTVVIYPKSAGAVGAFAAASGPMVASCIEQALKALYRDSFRSDPRLRSVDNLTVEVGELSIDPSGGDAEIGYQAKITASVNTFELEAYVDFEFVHVGRALALFTALSEFTPLTGTEDFVKPVVDRLQAV